MAQTVKKPYSESAPARACCRFLNMLWGGKYKGQMSFMMSFRKVCYHAEIPAVYPSTTAFLAGYGAGR